MIITVITRPYDLCCRNLSPLHYHILVVNSLGQLYKITKEPIFKIYHDKWADYKIPPVLLKMKKQPPPHVIYDNGIPILDYGYVKGIFVGMQLNPLTISHSALQYYDSYKQNGNNSSKLNFLSNVNWLVDNSMRFGLDDRKIQIIPVCLPFPTLDGRTKI